MTVIVKLTYGTLGMILRMIPSDWKGGIVVPIWKGKGDRECNNYRGVTLLSVPGKAFAWLVLNRIRPQLFG